MQVRSMSIHWLNNPEYMRLEEPWGGAFSAQVLHLRYVWWLHIGGTIRVRSVCLIPALHLYAFLSGGIIWPGLAVLFMSFI